jgi:hypothetical protein
MVCGPVSPWPNSRGGCLHMSRSDEVILDDGPSDSHLCKTNQHFVYLKSQNEVIV